MSAVLGFAVIAFTLIAVPGPDWAYVLAVGGRDHVVVPAVSGILAGYALITMVVVAGVGPLVAAIPAALTALTVVGAGYLVHLGVHTLRASAEVTQGDAARTPRRSSLQYLARGIGVSALNPKGLLIFLSILPQFATPRAIWPIPLQLAALGAVFIGICAVVYFAIGHTADRVLGSRPTIAWTLSRIAGTAMIVVGIALLAERLLTIQWQ